MRLEASLTKELRETVMQVRLGKLRHSFPHRPGVLPYRPGGELGAAGAEVGDLEPRQKKGLEGQLQHGHQAGGIHHQGPGSHNRRG